ncbi:MAG: TetR/AcrR family transcriptional regulator, partial [Pseudomonadales bacterium]|nr:TetR/AcrR family transcriptional regulator [Pseudomonadales bacterium]
LVAEQGIHHVTLKDIVKEAGQKNPSALQYHFKNLQGLLDAIRDRRSQQAHIKRGELIAQLEASNSPIKLRDLCELMILPSFLLAKSDLKYRQYVMAFSFDIVTSQDSALDTARKTGGGGESGAHLGRLLRKKLKHLDDKTYRARMDLAVRACSAAMGSYFQQKGAVKGAKAEFFLNNVVDALEGMLSAPETRGTNTLKLI